MSNDKILTIGDLEKWARDEIEQLEKDNLSIIKQFKYGDDEIAVDETIQINKLLISELNIFLEKIGEVSIAQEVKVRSEMSKLLNSLLHFQKKGTLTSGRLLFEITCCEKKILGEDERG